MAVDNIQIKISAKDDASKELNNVGGAFNKLGGIVSAAGAVIGAAFVAVGAAAVKFGLDSVKAFIQSEKEMAIANRSLENSIENMGKNSFAVLQKTFGPDGQQVFDGMKREMEAVGAAAVKLGYDDEAAAVGFAKLFSASQSLEQAQKDIKTAMDLAAYSGRDLQSAVQAVMMVHAGGTRVLKEFGIEVDKDITSVEALALIQEKAGGSAAAMADTTAGKLAVLAVSWSNLKESAGAALAEAIGPFITQLTEWVQSDKTQEAIAEITKQIAELAKQIMPFIIKILPSLLVVLKAVLIVMQSLIFGFKSYADFLGTVIFKVMQLTEWFGKMIDKAGAAIKKLKEWTTESAAGKALGNVVNFNPIGSLINALPKFAAGGYVNAPLGSAVPAILHGGEMVIPAGGAAGGIVLNITGNTFLDDYAAVKFGDQIAAILKKNLRL